MTLTEKDGRIDKRGLWVPPNNPGFSWEKRFPGQEPWTVGSQDAAQGPAYSGLCGEEIKKMVLARSQAGITSTSKVGASSLCVHSFSSPAAVGEFWPLLLL